MYAILFTVSIYAGKLRHSGYRNLHVNSVAKAEKRLREMRAS